MSNATPVDAATAATFEALMAAHRGIIVKIAASYCRDPDDRADLAQDIGLQLWRAWPSYEHARPFSTWMYRVALNVAVSHQRRQRLRSHEDVFDELHDQVVGEYDVDAESRERLALVQRAMQGLGGLDRALLLLYLEGCRNRESGDVLGISEGNVATRLGRIRQQLRRLTGGADMGAEDGTR